MQMQSTFSPKKSLRPGAKMLEAIAFAEEFVYPKVYAMHIFVNGVPDLNNRTAVNEYYHMFEANEKQSTLVHVLFYRN